MAVICFPSQQLKLPVWYFCLLFFFKYRIDTLPVYWSSIRLMTFFLITSFSALHIVIEKIMTTLSRPPFINCYQSYFCLFNLFSLARNWSLQYCGLSKFINLFSLARTAHCNIVDCPSSCFPLLETAHRNIVDVFQLDFSCYPNCSFQYCGWLLRNCTYYSLKLMTSQTRQTERPPSRRWPRQGHLQINRMAKLML